MLAAEFGAGAGFGGGGGAQSSLQRVGGMGHGGGDWRSTKFAVINLVRKIRYSPPPTFNGNSTIFFPDYF